MEKLEAVREYCIDRAITLLATDKATIKSDTKTVVTLAKELEAYITGETFIKLG